MHTKTRTCIPHHPNPNSPRFHCLIAGPVKIPDPLFTCRCLLLYVLLNIFMNGAARIISLNILIRYTGSDLIDWLQTKVEGLQERRASRKYASSLLKAGYIRHTVNKITFSEQCYYVFGEYTGSGLAKGWFVILFVLLWSYQDYLEFYFVRITFTSSVLIKWLIVMCYDL